MDMTKFMIADDPGFQAVSGELRRWTKQLSIPGNANAPQSRTTNSKSSPMETQPPRSEEHTLTINQEGSTFSGPTTVSGGSNFQGNVIGPTNGIFRN